MLLRVLHNPLHLLTMFDPRRLPPLPSRVPPCSMGYLKDVVLPRVLDDATFATLSSLMLFNNIEVGGGACCVHAWQRVGCLQRAARLRLAGL